MQMQRRQHDRLSPAAANKLRSTPFPPVIPIELREDEDYLAAELPHGIMYAFEVSGELSLHLYPTRPTQTLEGLQLLVAQARFLNHYLGMEATEKNDGERMEFAWELPFTHDNQLIYAQSATYLQRIKE